MRRARPGQLPREALLGAVPRKNPAVQWRELDSDRILVVYETADKAVVAWVKRFLAVSSVAELLLDEVGSKVVRRIDGRATVAQLIGFVADEFRLSRKEAEVALLKYLDSLARRNLVGLELRAADGGTETC